jgi:hypothetical protein
VREKVPDWQAKVQKALEACQEGGSLTEGSRWMSLQMGQWPAVRLLWLKLEPIESLKTISEKLVSIFPENGEPLWRLASEYLRLGDADKALLAAKPAAGMPMCHMMELTEVRMRRFARELASAGYDEHLCQFLPERVDSLDQLSSFIRSCDESITPELAVKLVEQWAHCHDQSLVQSYAALGRADMAASALAEEPETVDVGTLLSIGLVRLAEERVEDSSIGRDDRVKGLSQLRDFYRERDPAKSEELQRRIDSV